MFPLPLRAKDRLCCFIVAVNVPSNGHMIIFQREVQREIKIKCQRLEEVKSFKYLGFVISNGYTFQTRATFSRLKPFWRDKNIPLASKALADVDAHLNHLPICM